MLKLFSRILRNKKALLTFLFLTIIISGCALPLISHAQAYPVDYAKQQGIDTSGADSWFDFFGKLINGVGNSAFLWFTPVGGILGASILISDVAKTLFEGLVIKFAIVGTSYTNSPAVQIGWPIVRDLANMVIVLGFVVIGIATALRMKTYQANQLLAKLIIVALLVNFSKLICGVFVDATNILMDFFFKGVNNWSAFAPGATNAIAMVKSIESNNFAEFLPKVISMIAFNCMSALSYFLYALLFLLRIVAIWILVILSPLAFVCSVFPVTRGVWQMWLKNFTQWCFIVVPASLFYYIGFSMVNKSWANHTDISTIITQNWTTYISSADSMVIMPSMMLLVGFFVSLSFSAIGAKAALSWGQKTAMPAAAGALNKLHTNTTGKLLNNFGSKISGWGERLQNRPGASWVGKKIGQGMDKVGQGTSGLSDLKASSQKTRSAFGRLGETIGAKTPGLTDEADAKLVKEEAARIDFQYKRAKAAGDNKVLSRIGADAMLAKEGKGGIKSAASVRVVVGNKDINKVFGNDLAGASAAITYAEKQGAVDLRTDAGKTSPLIAGENVPAVDRVLTGMGIQPTAATPAQRADAKQEVMVRAALKTPEEDLDRSFVDSMDSETFAIVAQRMKPQKQQTLRRANEDSIFNQSRALTATNPAAGSPDELLRDQLTDKLATLRNINIP
jgi:hypothetical protein